MEDPMKSFDEVLADNRAFREHNRTLIERVRRLCAESRLSRICTDTV